MYLCRGVRFCYLGGASMSMLILDHISPEIPAVGLPVILLAFFVSPDDPIPRSMEHSHANQYS